MKPEAVSLPAAFVGLGFFGATALVVEAAFLATGVFAATLRAFFFAAPRTL